MAHGLTVGGAITKAFTWLITFFTFLVSHILNVAASLFDFSIKFATEYVPEKIFEQTYPVWSGIRDLGNLVIILFLGFIAISLITGFLGQATKKSVVWVLAAALLINFSGVLTLFVYNTGNALAKSFLNDIKEVKFVSSEGKKDKPCGGKVAQCIANQISITAKDESARHKEIIDKYTKSGTAEQDNLIEKRNAIQDACQKVVEDLFKNITLPATTKANLNEVNNARSELTKDKTEKYNQCVNQKIAELDDNELRLAAFNDFDKLGKENLNKAAFASSILIFMLNIMLIVAFAYAAAGLFVVGVGIVIIYIISPIGLAAYMISKTGIPTGILGNIKDEWWKNLWGFSFFTPVFFVGLWITVKLISVFKTTAENASDFSISSSAVGIILVYIMFMKSFEFAKATSGEIANGINKIKDGAQKTTKFAYNNKLTNAVKDGLGHGLNKVSGGRFATQASLRHEKRAKEREDFLKYGLTSKNSSGRAVREHEEAKKDFERKGTLSSLNAFEAKEKELHARLGTKQTAKSTEAYKEARDSLEKKEKLKGDATKELFNLEKARDIAKEDLDGHKYADGKTKVEKRIVFLEAEKAIEQFKTNNPDAFNYHEQARKYKANELHKKEEMHNIGKEMKSLNEQDKKLDYQITSISNSKPKTEKGKKAKKLQLKNLEEKRKKNKETVEDLSKKQRNMKKNNLFSNSEGQQINLDKIKEKETKAKKGLENIKNRSTKDLDKEIEIELNDSKKQVDIEDKIHLEDHKQKINSLKQEKREEFKKRLSAARNTFTEGGEGFVKNFVNATREVVKEGKEAKRIKKERKIIDMERKEFKNKNQKELENIYKEAEKKAGHKANLIKKERMEAEKEFDTQRRMYKKTEESIKEKFVLDDQVKNLQHTGDFTKKSDDKKKDKKSEK